MNLFYTLLLLLLLLSGFSESLQHVKPPDLLHTTRVTVCIGSAQLGVLAPVLPQNEVFRIALPQNGVFGTILPQNEVFKIPQLRNEVYKIALLQNEVLTLSEVLNLTRSKLVLPPNEVFKIVAANCQLFNNL